MNVEILYRSERAVQLMLRQTRPQSLRKYLQVLNTKDDVLHATGVLHAILYHVDLLVEKEIRMFVRLGLALVAAHIPEETLAPLFALTTEAHVDPVF